MRRKRHMSAGFGFSNERFSELLFETSGITPVGYLGRETPLSLTTREDAQWTLLAREVYSKYDDGKPSKEKEELTWKRFHLAESSCEIHNKVFPRLFNSSSFWKNVYRRIDRTLGVFSWDECQRFFSFGPGATTRLPRQRASAAYKYSGIPESTAGNAILGTCAIRMNPLWIQSVRLSEEEPDNLVKIVKGNSIIVVPKNYKTDRTIAKEPDMNMYIQKGIGRVIRNRLKSVGVDLNDQTRNQRAAREGSLTGQLATIDLSMASDTVSFGLVSSLLPNDWWYALEQSRSPVGVLPSGEVLPYQKFSSMGNGYTFELESLIFWAIAQEVCATNINETESQVLVYGDDIVVPSDKAVTFIERLKEGGFTPNDQKSFHEGPYRESCGKHYFQGQDITPFYVRKPVQTLDRLFLAHNNVYRWGERTSTDVTSTLTKLKGLAPSSWRTPRLPDGYGDGAFIGAVDELRLDSHPYGWEYWVTKVLQVSSDELADELPFGQMIASLMQLSTVVNTPFERKFDVVCAYNRLRRFTVKGLRAQMAIEEHNSGLPVKVGRYRQVNMLIPQHTLA